MIIIALGSNLPSDYGNSQATLELALQKIEAYGVSVVAVSKWYETEPVPKSDQPNYVNGVAVVDTNREAADLLACLHEIEHDVGRRRTVVNAARCLDLDLVDYHGEVHNGDLVLPHPRMHDRGFVLFPLYDVAPDWCHPVLGKSVSELITALPDDQKIA